MKKETIDQITNLLQEHPELSEQLSACASGASSQLIENAAALLKEYGVELTEDDLQIPQEELDDDELNAVTGGGGCGCSVGGYGAGDGLKCVCFLGGTGSLRERKKATTFLPRHQALGLLAEDLLENNWNKGGCVCVAAGAGATNLGS